jgi:cytochrome c553
MSIRWTLLVGGMALAVGTAAAHAAGNAAAGQTKSAMCAGCHGATGQGNGPNPRLAGLSAAQLTQALQGYKSGQLKQQPMASITAGLSGQDIENLAAYYASLH